MSPSQNNNLPTRFGFLLLDDFTLISLSAAIEPLRMVNRLLGEEYYGWKTISVTGESVAASDGLKIHVDHNYLDDGFLGTLDIIIVCGGINVEQQCSKKTIKWLRQVDKQGVKLGAICTGSYVLAHANLLDGYQCSIHWENLAVLRESHPRVNVNARLFSIDRNRYSSSGGTAPIDMMLHLISVQHGEEMAAAVAEQFICDRIRHADDNQRIPLWHILGMQSSKLTAVVELMEANIEEPISKNELAEFVDLSLRQLERLFRKYLFCTPSRYYLRLRLQRARDLLQKTNLNILDVSLACGFISTSHFSKSYKEFYSYSPSLERLQESERQSRLVKAVK